MISSAVQQYQGRIPGNFFWVFSISITSIPIWKCAQRREAKARKPTHALVLSQNTMSARVLEKIVCGIKT